MEKRFRETVLGLAAVSGIDARAACGSFRILVAAIIEDLPYEEEYGSRIPIEDDLGIEYEQESYPTVYWKSPFFAFLQINPAAALGGLNQLSTFVPNDGRMKWPAKAGRQTKLTVHTR